MAQAATRLEGLDLEVLPTTDLNPGFDDGHSATRRGDWLHTELMRFRNLYLAAAQVEAGIIVNF